MWSFVRETSPRRVLFGVGQLARLPAEVVALGRERVLVVTGGSAQSIGRQAAEMLGRRCAGVLSEVCQHVPEELAGSAVETAKDTGADALVCVGGGSATGLAKAIALELGIPIVAVPTTYSGSEMTPVWGISGRHKRTGRDARVAPGVVLYDPEVTEALPPGVTAASGLNALAHAVSILLSGSDRVDSLHAAEAARVLARSLPRAVSAPSDMGARSEVLFAAYLAGDALASGRLEGIHHRLCHIVGGTYRLSHAGVHAVLLPHTLAHHQRRDMGRVDPVGVAVQAQDPAAWVHGFARRLGAPASLRELGMPADGLTEAGRRAAETLGEPFEELHGLLDDAYEGRAPHTEEQKGAAS